MGTKTYKLRLDFKLLDQLHRDQPDQYPYSAADVHQWLWDTHVAFNSGVDYLATWLLRLYRGAGVWRERTDGIWGNWNSIASYQALVEARANARREPARYALIENRELLSAFVGAGVTEERAVELADCCRHIALTLCPPSDERDNRQMPRDSLDLLVSPFSEARGLRGGKTALYWELVRLAKRHDSFEAFLDSAAGLLRKQPKHSDADVERLRRWVIDALLEVDIDKHYIAGWCGRNISQSQRQANRPLDQD